MTRKQFILAAPFAATLMRGADVARVAPELLLTDTSGRQIRLSLLRGKVVVLELMLTDLSPLPEHGEADEPAAEGIRI